MVFKNWSFRLLIYNIILQVCLAILYLNAPVVWTPGIHKPQTQTNFAIQFLNFLIPVLFVLGLAFLAVSIFKNEERDYRFYVALIGYLLLFIIPSVLLFV